MKTGVQSVRNCWKRRDSGFRRNDGKRPFPTFYETVKFASLHEWKSFIDGIPEKNYRDFEWQANEFAGRLLVPPAELKKEVKKAYEVIRANHDSMRYLEMDSDAVLSGVSPMLCKPFGVSTDVIETRARREGLWPPT